MKLTKISLIVFILIIGITNNTKAYFPIVTIGPMFHYNFSSEESSIGIELSLWDDRSKFQDMGYPSIDFGLEYSKETTTVYSEFQLGLIYYGASVGPCLNIARSDNHNMKLGLQTTFWADYFIPGIDFRLRIFNDDFTPYLGGFLKISNASDNSF